MPLVSDICCRDRCRKRVKHVIQVYGDIVEFRVCDDCFNYLMEKGLITDPYVGIGLENE